MKTINHEQLILPALKGIMGNWVYYSCLMNLEELSKRVEYAHEIHENQHLSDMIQRTLNGDRSTKIANYLTQPERFFNSLVIAVYGGSPNWEGVSRVNPREQSSELASLSEETLGSVGFITLRGDEKLFAIDGQHRLAGIKKAILKGVNVEPNDDVSVIFVAHKQNVKGLERTRRLFTTLNKTAKPVSKGDIIALDEDSVPALCVRYLIERTTLFGGERIAFVASNNMPIKNQESLTTIGNLYDTLQLLFSQANIELKTKKELLQVRPDDSKLEHYFQFSESYFRLLSKHFPELKSFFSAKNSSLIVNKYRGSHGGNALFRPIGLEIFTKIIIALCNKMSLEEAIKQTALLPRIITQAPYKGLMWDPSNQTISNAHKVTLREILLYMVGHSKLSKITLTEKYRKETGNPKINLPAQVI